MPNKTAGQSDSLCSTGKMTQLQADRNVPWVASYLDKDAHTQTYTEAHTRTDTHTQTHTHRSAHEYMNT